MRNLPRAVKSRSLGPKSFFGQIAVTMLGISAAIYLVLYIATLYSSSRDMSRQMVQSNVELVNQTSGTVDQMLDNLSLMLYNTFMGPDVIRLAISPSLREFENMKSITDALTNAAGSSTLIDSAFLYSTRSELGLSSDYTLSNYQDNSYAGVLARFQTRQNKLTPYEAHNSTTYIYTENSDIYLIQGFSNAKYEKCSCYLLFHLNSQPFYQTINSTADTSMMFFNSMGTQMFVKDQDPQRDRIYQAVANRGDDAGYFLYDIDSGKSSYIIYRQNERTGWMCIYATEPVNRFMTSFLSSAALVQLGILLSVVLILAAVFWNARRISRPISTLVQKVQASTGDAEIPNRQSEWEYLEHTYAHLLTQKEELERYLPLAADAVHGRLFRGLLRREELSREWISQQLLLIRSPFSLDMPCTAICVYVELSRSNHSDRLAQEVALLNLKNKITHILTARSAVFQLVELSSNRLNLVYAFPNKECVHVEYEALKQELRAIVLELGRPVWGMGGLVENLQQLGDSMADAKNDLEFNQYHDDAPAAESACEDQYTVYIGQIRNLLTKVQDEEGTRLADALHTLLLDIWENVDDRSQVRQLYDLLFERLSERMKNLKMEFVPAEFSLHETADEQLYEHAQMLCEQILMLLGGHFRSGQYLYVSRVRDYIHTHYNDPSLSLERAAEYVGINSAYLSRIFKTIEGQNFNTYLNAYRVENAQKLLETTNMPAQEIGYLTGFCSVATFFRVFKKHTEMTPKQYRQGICGERTEE